MRLLHTQKSDAGIFEIKEFLDKIPHYAILSHRWGSDEVTLQDIERGCGTDRKGYEKVAKCCAKAKDNGYAYVWIDTCCIDKTSSAELSEAINSMYRWYRDAKLCYAYLADVPLSKADISGSKWFNRGWTLQELIAPPAVIFLDAEWNERGTRTTLQQEISGLTNIPPDILSKSSDLENFSIAQRMSWAARRKTSRVEDKAYCLMGLFGVNMPLIYGEGDRAFLRLQEEIMRISDDYSLFAWKSEDNRGGLLAMSPAAFINSNNIIQSDPFSTHNSPLVISSHGVQLELRFMGIGPQGLGFAILPCKERDGKGEPIAIYVKDLHLTMGQFGRVRSGEFKRLDLSKFRQSQYPIRRIRIRKGHNTNIRRPKPNGQCDNPAPEPYPAATLIQLMSFGNPEALHQAIQSGDESVVWLLLTRSDFEVNRKDKDNRAVLSYAAQEGNEILTRQLLARSGIKTDLADNRGWTALFWAVEKGHKAVVKLLLEKGADLETKDQYGRTPLSWAAANGYEAIVQLLLEKGADLDTKDHDGRTPLSLATENGHEAMIQLLLEKGADLETKNQYGRTPLSLAVEEGHEDIVQLLLEKGADPDTKDHDGWTPLSLAAANGHEAIVQLLLEKGADLDTKNQHGRTPLSLAAEEGHEAIVQLLLEKGADLDTKNQHGRTPLSFATAHRHEAIVQLLLEKGADPDTKDHDGRTPLSLAAEEGHEAIVQLLLEKGADPDTKDQYGQTPLSLATEKKHGAVAQLLLQKGVEAAKKATT
ncbi:hypothetical protein BP5796_12554 [Coleophoma crateriformis]|uniref:Uncharacterized protein n=1 Tax=Coleophoma crateriformis TaxID=565419 RepID=A0A3D8Q7F7_9HELO|nr:hypothetical protein BP5796_12554 [Coleophoma crateriformis]